MLDGCTYAPALHSSDVRRAHGTRKMWVLGEALEALWYEMHASALDLEPRRRKYMLTRPPSGFWKITKISDQ